MKNQTFTRFALRLVRRFTSVASAFLLLCAFTHMPLQAQDSAAARSSFTRFGLFAGLGVYNHNANFTDFPNFIAEPSALREPYGGISALMNPSFGALVEFPLFDRLGVSLRGSLGDVAGGFRLVQKEYALQPSSVGNVPFVLEISHVLTIDRLQMLATEPYLTYRLLDFLTLYAGARFGSFLGGSQYRYMQSIPEDSPVRFVNAQGQPTTEYDARSGEIPALTALHASLAGGFSIELPLEASGRWFAALEAFYFHGVSSLAENLVLRRPVPIHNGLSATRAVSPDERGTDRDPLSMAWPSEITEGSWTTNNLRVGISFRYAP
jgi:hypothetical protein